MYSDKTQKVHIALTEQTNVLKTEDNNHVMFDGTEEVQSISKLEFKETVIPLERVLVELRNGRCIGQFYLTNPYRRKKGSHPSHDWRARPVGLVLTLMIALLPQRQCTMN